MYHEQRERPHAGAGVESGHAGASESRATDALSLREAMSRRRGSEGKASGPWRSAKREGYHASNGSAECFGARGETKHHSLALLSVTS